MIALGALRAACLDGRIRLPSFEMGVVDVDDSARGQMKANTQESFPRPTVAVGTHPTVTVVVRFANDFIRCEFLSAKVERPAP